MGELAVEQGRDRIVTFTVKRGEYENQYAQHDASDEKFLPILTEFPVHSLHPVHHLRKIEGYQATEHAEQKDVGYAFDHKHFGLREGEHRFRPCKDIGDSRSCH